MRKNYNRKHLGFLIKIARGDAKLTQTQLAKKMKTKQPAIARAENEGCELGFCEKAVGECGFIISNIALRAKDPFKSGLTFYG